MSDKTSIIHVPMQDLLTMAKAIAQSGLFGIKTETQAVALMVIAQAEGRHPALAARDYHIVDGRPSKKAEAMLRDFIEAGGKVEWKESTDKAAEAIFSHPSGGSLPIRWDEAKAKQAELWGRANWKKYPAAMLRARVVSEGIRAVYPGATSGMYVPEEVQDFDDKPRNVTPPKDPAPQAPIDMSEEFPDELPLKPPSLADTELRLEIQGLLQKVHADFPQKSLDELTARAFKVKGMAFQHIAACESRAKLEAAKKHCLDYFAREMKEDE